MNSEVYSLKGILTPLNAVFTLGESTSPVGVYRWNTRRQGEGIPPNSHPYGARHQAQSHQSYGPEGHPIVGGFLHNVFRRGRRFHTFLLPRGRSGVHLRDRGVNLSGTGITLRLTVGVSPLAPSVGVTGCAADADPLFTEAPSSPLGVAVSDPAAYAEVRGDCPADALVWGAIVRACARA